MSSDTAIVSTVDVSTKDRMGLDFDDLVELMELTIIDASVKAAQNQRNWCDQWERAMGLAFRARLGDTAWDVYRWRDRDGYDRDGLGQDGYDRGGFDRHGWHRDTGLDRYGYGRDGFHRDNGRDRNGYDRDGFDTQGYGRDGFHRDNGRDRRGYDRDGFDTQGFDRDGLDRLGYRRPS